MFEVLIRTYPSKPRAPYSTTYKLTPNDI